MGRQQLQASRKLLPRSVTMAMANLGLWPIDPVGICCERLHSQHQESCWESTIVIESVGYTTLRLGQYSLAAGALECAK